MITVIAGAIYRGDKILIARRSKDDPLEGFWEFPGGKLEEGETHIQCLARELSEELGIDAQVDDYIGTSIYAYEHITVKLVLYRVTRFSGTITAIEHAELRWITAGEFGQYTFPPADEPLLNILKE